MNICQGGWVGDRQEADQLRYEQEPQCHKEAQHHYDIGNSGPMYGVSFGEFIGGKHWTKSEGGDHHVVRKDFRAGGGIHLFDGNQIHFTSSFTGERYAVLYCVHSRGQFIVSCADCRSLFGIIVANLCVWRVPTLIWTTRSWLEDAEPFTVFNDIL